MNNNDESATVLIDAENISKMSASILTKFLAILKKQAENVIRTTKFPP